MKENRYFAACTVYEGKIVESGGWSSKLLLKSVETFDYYENKWIYLPDMIEKRNDHASVTIGNKLFVIGGYRMATCEMFDSCTRKFCYIKSCSGFPNNLFRLHGVSISNQIVIFAEVCNEFHTEIFTCCTETYEWKSIDCDVLKNKSQVSCVKYHQ